MDRCLIGFSLGVMSLLFFPNTDTAQRLWPIGLSVAGGLLVVCYQYRQWPHASRWLQKLRVGCALLLSVCVGLAWVSVHAARHQRAILPASLEKKPLTLTGTIVHQPKAQALSTQFYFRIDTWPKALRQHYSHLPKTLVLRWYRLPSTLTLQPGQRWQLRLSLKRPHGLVNPGGFDYEKSLFSQRIGARGTVIKGDNRLLHAPTGGYHLWRHRIINACEHYLNGSAGGKILALLTGERKLLSSQDYQILARTGTHHLLAISGLHVGLVAGFCYFFISMGWRCLPRLCERVAAQRAGALAALVGALGYSALAGFSPPTLRALIMLTVVMLTPLCYTRSQCGDRLVLALCFILIISPLVILSMSFWLSFTAVVALVYVGQYRYRTRFAAWFWLQWRLLLALMPASLWFFQQHAWLAPLTNAVAIPWVSFAVLPPALLALLSLPLSPSLASGLFELSMQSLSLLWTGLVWVASWPGTLWQFAFVNIAHALLCGSAIALLLLPRAIPGKWLGLMALLACYQMSLPAVVPGRVEVTTLDVGQGLAMVIRSASQVIVYDTGPGFKGSMDSGATVVIPYLRSQGVRTINKLIVSHNDNDHVGGLDSLMSQFKVEQLLLSEPLTRYPNAKVCNRQPGWQIDGIRFRLLWPPNDYNSKRNNRSCVLLIDNGFYRALLTGDIEKSAEKRLLGQGESLQADVLIAPHHGSRSSSSPAFVNAVAPRWVVYPVGYLNRFRFPATSTVSIYRQHGAQQLSTSNHGTLRFTLSAGEHGIKWQSFRQNNPRFWRDRVK